MIKEPYYTVELTAIACYVEILINDVPVISIEANGQISPNIPINYAITNSGIQKISAKMTPLTKETKLRSNAELSYCVRLFDVANDQFVFIKNFAEQKIATDEKSKSFPFIIKLSEFEAEIPYTLTKWDNATNLKDLKDLKQKLEASYNYIGKIIDKGNYNEFAEIIKSRENNMAISMYLSEINSKARINSLIDDAKNGFKIMPLAKDVVLKLYGYGKLASLKKINREPALFLFNEETNEELMLDLMFYIPEGKTEFEVI